MYAVICRNRKEYLRLVQEVIFSDRGVKRHNMSFEEIQEILDINVDDFDAYARRPLFERFDGDGVDLDDLWVYFKTTQEAIKKRFQPILVTWHFSREGGRMGSSTFRIFDTYPISGLSLSKGLKAWQECAADE